jgi:hypothetical protein
LYCIENAIQGVASPSFHFVTPIRSRTDNEIGIICQKVIE